MTIQLSCFNNIFSWTTPALPSILSRYDSTHTATKLSFVKIGEKTIQLLSGKKWVFLMKTGQQEKRSKVHIYSAMTGITETQVCVQKQFKQIQQDFSPDPLLEDFVMFVFEHDKQFSSSCQMINKWSVQSRHHPQCTWRTTNGVINYHFTSYKFCVASFSIEQILVGFTESLSYCNKLCQSRFCSAWTECSCVKQ